MSKTVSVAAADDGWLALDACCLSDEGFRAVQVGGLRLLPLLKGIQKEQQLFDLRNRRGQITLGCRLSLGRKSEWVSHEEESWGVTDRYLGEGFTATDYSLLAKNSESSLRISDSDSMNYKIRFSGLVGVEARRMWAAAFQAAREERILLKREMRAIDRKLADTRKNSPSPKILEGAVSTVERLFDEKQRILAELRKIEEEVKFGLHQKKNARLRVRLAEVQRDLAAAEGKRSAAAKLYNGLVNLSSREWRDLDRRRNSLCKRLEAITDSAEQFRR